MSELLDDRFFRRESARLIAMLTRTFGVGHLALVEDVVQETLARAFESWTLSGVPAHASALLVTAARNRALDVLRHDAIAERLAPEIARTIERTHDDAPLAGDVFLPEPLRDDELRMMFTCCHPRISEEAQVALVLAILCGFGVREIASAFLASEAAIEKRLSRAKKVLAESTRLFELGADDFPARLSAVHRALYLLFNEGYHGACAESVVRRDLCHEAMRLVRLLLEHPPAATPATHALAALMWLHAARLPARIDEGGNLTALFEQDRSRWDARLVAEGFDLLAASAVGDELSPYHVEAGIAAMHASAARAEDTPWGEIVALYDVLLRMRPSPVVALGRAIALAEHEGPERGLEAIAAIGDGERLAAYPFLAAAIAELELRCGRVDAARSRFEAARRLARNDGERRFLDRRIAACAPHA